MTDTTYCYWEDDGDADYEPRWYGQCGGRAWEVSKLWEYCPFCGKRIFFRDRVTHDMMGVRRWVR